MNRRKLFSFLAVSPVTALVVVTQAKNEVAPPLALRIGEWKIAQSDSGALKFTRDGASTNVTFDFRQDKKGFW